MGLKDFFGKVWKGIKTGASWIGDKVKKGVGFVGRLAKPILNITRMIPGAIGKASNIANVVLDGVSAITGSLPDSKVKNKIGEITSEMKTGTNKIFDKASDISGKVGNVVETTAPLVEKANNWVNKFTPQQMEQYKNTAREYTGNRPHVFEQNISRYMPR